MTRSGVARCLVIASLMAVGAVRAQAQATGEPGDAATKPAAASIVYDGTGFSNLAGGVRRGEVYLGTLNVALSIDGARLLHVPRLSAYADVVWIHGGQPDALAGDAQGVSNLTGPAAVRLEEAWVQLNLFENRVSMLVGRYDLNTEFYRTQSAGLFLNSSFGVGPEFSQSGRAGPSVFPTTSIGARFAFKPHSNIVIRTAVFDGVPIDRQGSVAAAFQPGDGLLLLSEAAFLRRPAPAEQRPRKIRFRIGRASGLPPYDAKAAVGGWYYTATFPDLSRVGGDGRPLRHSGSGGAYGLVDTVLLQRHGDHPRRLTGFIEAGLGDQRVNRFEGHLVAGLVATGVVRSRSADELGVALAWTRNGSRFIDMQEHAGIPTGGAETAIEVTWLSQLASWLAIQPDFQYVVRPDTSPSVPNASAAQIRFEVRF